MRGFDATQQVPSTPTTSDQRWSEFVPPDAGLTFAVVWDPDKEGILTFSAPGLLSDISDELRSPDSPSDTDGRSQILTIGPSFLSPSENNTGTLQYFRENHDFLFPEGSAPCSERPTRRQTRTSSTMDGLDVYLRGSMFGRVHKADRYLSCLRGLEGAFTFDPRTSFAHAWQEYMEHGIKSNEVSDEGFFEAGGRFSIIDDSNNLSSAFSVTTTSTSDYVTVENEMDDDGETTAWSALEPPNTPGYAHGLMYMPVPAPRQPHRLRKTRHVPGPASPYAVLHRAEYNHTCAWSTPPALLPPPPPPPSRPRTPTARLTRHLSLPRLPRSLSFAKSIRSHKVGPDAPGGWVWINVKDDDRNNSTNPRPPVRRASE